MGIASRCAALIIRPFSHPLVEMLFQYGIILSLICAVAGLLFAGWLIRGILAASPGNERMRQIAGAIEEGAKAYLHRQIVTISRIAAVIFLLLLLFKDHLLRDGAASSLGFLVGAVCSLAAGFIGMRIAVMANIRTAQAATKDRHSALKAAFNGGAVTGLLVVGLALLAVGVFYLVAYAPYRRSDAGGQEPRRPRPRLLAHLRLCPARRRHLYQGRGRRRRSRRQDREQPRRG